MEATTRAEQETINPDSCLHPPATTRAEQETINPDSCLPPPSPGERKTLEQAVEAKIAPLAEAVARLEAKLLTTT